MNKFLKTKYGSRGSRQGGFTLAETLVVIFVSGILMMGTTLLMKNILTFSKQQGLVLNNIDQAKRVANTFMNELRNGAYGINGAYPVASAGDTQIIFFSTSPKGNGVVSKVRYYISSGALYKGVTDPSGNPLSYNGTEVITKLITDMSLGVSPLFYYYDGNYNGSGNPITQPVNINQVKFIKMNLIVLKQAAAASTSTFTISGGAAIRNLKTNLGN